MKKSKKSNPVIKKDFSRYRKIFYLILVLLPFFFILFLELILKLFSYGGELDLFIPREINGKKYYFINIAIGRKYFSNQSFYLITSEDFFESKKSPNTIRVFCVGESSTLGYPYMYASSFPSLLKDRLEEQYPDKNIEMVNLGMTAISSICVKNLLDEALNYEPDLVIIYTGHNEFYGAYGIGSLESSNGIFITDLSLKLRKFRTFLLVEDMIKGIFKIFRSGGENNGTFTLMELLAKEKSIAYRSEMYNRCKLNFAKNIEDMVEDAGKKGIPVILSSLISNIKDQYPFNSIHAGNLAAESVNKYKSFIKNGRIFKNENKLNEAIREYREAIKIDPLSAEAHFELAECLLLNNEFENAKGEFLTAKDYDGLRFRASEDFNEELRLIAGRKNVLYLSMKDSLEKYSVNGIIGKEFILEHLHPNYSGYFLMAKIFSRFINGNKLFGNHYSENNDEYYSSISGFNVTDSIAAEMRIKILTNRWPFTNSSRNIQIRPTNEIENLADKMCKADINWEEAQVKSGNYYLNMKDYYNASRAFRALIKVTPYNSSPYKYLGECLLNMRNLNPAEKVFRKLLLLEPSAEVYEKLGAINVELQKPSEAIDFLNKSIDIDINKNSSNILLRKYLLALAYMQLKKYELAQKELEYVTAREPNYLRTNEILNFINLEKKK